MDELAKSKKKSFKLPLFAAGFFILGIVSFVIVRFLTITDNHIHYHANFALFINGERDEFESFTYYEEIQACSSENENNVKAKVHMHDKNAGLIHVHGAGATWGQFFANLGYGLSNKSIATDEGVFADGAGDELTFILNGKLTKNLANEVIGNEDKLLINFGKDDSVTLDSRYNSIQGDAHEANTKNDPSTCSGGNSQSFADKLNSAIGINQSH